MTKAIYYIYKDTNTNAIRVYPQEQELHRIVSKKQFRGWDNTKKAKIEAIYRLTGERLPDEATAAQIKDYISKNIYSTPKWMKYRQIYSELYMKEEKVVEVLEFVSKIEVSFSVSVVPDDIRLLHLIKYRLEGRDKTSFRGMENCIVSLNQVL